MPIIAINKQTGKLEREPEIVTRGFAVDDPRIAKEAKAVALRALESLSPEERADYSITKEKIRNELKRYVHKATSRRPLILPVILEL